MKYLKLFEDIDRMSEEDIIKAIKDAYTSSSIRFVVERYIKDFTGENLNNPEFDLDQLDSELESEDDDNRTGYQRLWEHVTYSYLEQIQKSIEKYVEKEVRKYLGEVLLKRLEREPILYNNYKDLFDTYIDDIPEHLKRSIKTGLWDLEKS